MATRSNRTKRPGKAAVARLRAEIEARPPRRLPPPLTQVIDDYRPARLNTEELDRIKPFLIEAISAAHLTGAESVRKHCNHLAQLAEFGMGRGTPLTVGDLLTTDFIDEYVRIGMSEASDHLRAERRRRLLGMARAANPGPQTPAKLTPIPHSSIKACYTPRELAVIIRACQVQPTLSRRRDLALVVALAAGAGLDSVDLRHLRTDHIDDRGDGGIRVRVPGPRSRIVTVRATCELLLRDVLASVHAGELVIGRRPDRRNIAARAVERAVLHNVPHIEPARLRATWLADLMTDPVPLAVILQAAGLKSARTLNDLEPHLGPWLLHKGLSRSDSDKVVHGVLRGECQ